MFTKINKHKERKTAHPYIKKTKSCRSVGYYRQIVPILERPPTPYRAVKSGHYASYWNAFLLLIKSSNTKNSAR